MKRIALTVNKNSGLYFVGGLRTDQDISAWQAKAYLFATAAPTVALKTLTTTIDATDKEITAAISPTDLAALYTDHASVGISVLVDPNLGYAVQMFFGTVSLEGGGPAWT